MATRTSTGAEPRRLGDDGVALEHRGDVEHADAEDTVAAGEKHRARGRMRRSRPGGARIASPISQVAGARMTGQVAGSMQCVGQSQSANET